MYMQFLLQLCVRGLVHVFKYLDTMAIKEEKSRGGTGNSVFDGHTTLRRNTTAKISTRVIDSPKLRQQNAESSYATANDTSTNGSTPESESYKWSPTSAHNRTLTNENVSPSTTNSSHSNSYTQDQFDGSFEKATNGSRLNGGTNNNRLVCGCSSSSLLNINFPNIMNFSWLLKTQETKLPIKPKILLVYHPIDFVLLLFYLKYLHIYCSTDVSPDGVETPESQKSGDRLKSILGNVQTYRLVIYFLLFRLHLSPILFVIFRFIHVISRICSSNSN